MLQQLQYKTVIMRDQRASYPWLGIRIPDVRFNINEVIWERQGGRELGLADVLPKCPRTARARPGCSRELAPNPGLPREEL